jgi:nuclease S1
MVTRILTLALLLSPVSAWGWGYHGHRIVAVIAADNLTPAAQSHVAGILGVPTENRAIAEAMASISILPDSEFKERIPATAPWHFINICLQDPRADIAKRCPDGECVVGKIDEYSRRLKESNYDRWGEKGDLAFLIHFIGDIHQPLHAANNADKGGNCVAVDSHHREAQLHAVWDDTLVRLVEDRIDSGRPEPTAHKLEQIYAGEKARDGWIVGHTDDIALESNQIASSEIYRALQIPIEPCEASEYAGCIVRPIDLNATYMDHAGEIAGHQLAKAGFRLASLLNGIWTQPFVPNSTTHAANSDLGQHSSGTTIAGQIVGNRRSKIYAWPGCGSYDTMAPQNRVVFSSRETAEQAGYRAAYNCP